MGGAWRASDGDHNIRLDTMDEGLTRHCPLMRLSPRVRPGRPFCQW